MADWSSHELYRALQSVFSEEQAERLAQVLTDVLERVRKEAEDRRFETLVTKDEFAELRGIIARLASSQEELAQAQKRTEEALQALAETAGDLRTEVGVLSESVGLGLEDLGHAVLPAYMESTYGIREVTFSREFFEVDGMEVEINLYAEGKRDGEEIVPVGEAKNRIKRAEVRKFTKWLQALEGRFDKPLFPFMFGYWIHPSVSELAREHGVELIVSYKLTR